MLIKVWRNPRALVIGKLKAAVVIFRALLLFAFLICFLTPASVRAQITVLELFTSAGCPSCPKADQNFNVLVQNPDVIGLSCHVTYFDRAIKLGALSRPFCDARQGVYKIALKTGALYTPMMIINGQTVLTGTKQPDVQKALSATRAEIAVIGVQAQQGYLDIRLPRMNVQSSELWLVEYAPQAGQGYKNVVTNFTKLMNWNGQPITMAYPASSGKNYAVIAQNFKTGVVAAGKTL